MTPPTKLTYDDYFALEDERYFELIDGVLHVKPTPWVRHQDVSGNLLSALYPQIDRRQGDKLVLGPFDIVLTPHDVLQPDLIYISNERRSIITDPCLRGAPDLVIEIIFHATALRDRLEKPPIYHRHGLRELWIVDPYSERIEVFRAGPERFELGGIYSDEDQVRCAVLPKLTLRAIEAFEGEDTRQALGAITPLRTLAASGAAKPEGRPSPC